MCCLIGKSKPSLRGRENHPTKESQRGRQKRLNHPRRKKSVLLVPVEKKRLASLDVLKNGIDTSKSLNFITRGLERLTLALGLAYPGERCSDGWPMVPFQKPDDGADGLASLIRMSALCSSGGNREIAMAYSSTEN